MKADYILTENEQQQVTGGTFSREHKIEAYKTLMALIQCDLEKQAVSYFKAAKVFLKKAEEQEVREAFYNKYGYAIDGIDTL